MSPYSMCYSVSLVSMPSGLQSSAVHLHMLHERNHVNRVMQSAGADISSLCVQHYLTMLGSTVLIPFLLVPSMGGTPVDLAHVIGTIFFMSGWITIMQTVIGDRLPIVQVWHVLICL